MLFLGELVSYNPVTSTILLFHDELLPFLSHSSLRLVVLFLRRVVLLPLLRRRRARHTRQLQANPTPHTAALRRTTLRP